MLKALICFALMIGIGLLVGWAAIQMVFVVCATAFHVLMDLVRPLVHA